MGRARWGVTGVFALSGVCCALWSAALPTLIGRLHLDPGRMGTVLLLAGLGSILVMPLVGRLCDRCSSRTVLLVCAPTAALCLLAPAGARGFPELLAAGLLVGAGLGALDVSMNAQAVFVETAAGRPLMSGFHGVWSVGAVVGGAVVAAGLGSGADLPVLLATAGLLCALLFAGPLLLTRVPAASGSAPAAGDSGRPLPDQAVARPPLSGQLIVLLGLLAMAGFISEGAGYSWAVLHATTEVHVHPATASLAYTDFAGAIACSRLLGDRWRSRLGPRKGIALAGAVAVLGYLLVLTAPRLAAAGPVADFAGWAVVGIGLATVVPTLFSAAGSGGGEVGRALSRVTAFAYVGLLCGPALVGLIADRTSLNVALLLPAALALTVALCGPAVIARVTGGGPAPGGSAATGAGSREPRSTALAVDTADPT